jgi:hypothetical protein
MHSLCRHWRFIHPVASLQLVVVSTGNHEEVKGAITLVAPSRPQVFLREALSY